MKIKEKGLGGKAANHRRELIAHGKGSTRFARWRSLEGPKRGQGGKEGREGYILGIYGDEDFDPQR